MEKSLNLNAHPNTPKFTIFMFYDELIFPMVVIECMAEWFTHWVLDQGVCGSILGSSHISYIARLNLYKSPSGAKNQNNVNACFSY